MSRVNHLSSLSLLAVLVLAGCSSQAPQPLKKGEKAIDVASVVRQKMPASVKDRDAWAKDLATTFESQGLAPTLENVCSVLAVAQQESNYQADPAVPGLSKIAWQEIDRRAERMHIPAFLVHTALKIKSPNGKSYSERLDSVRTEKQLSAIFDDLISMVPMGQTLFGSLNPVRTGGPMQVSIAFAEQQFVLRERLLPPPGGEDVVKLAAARKHDVLFCFPAVFREETPHFIRIFHRLQDEAVRREGRIFPAAVNVGECPTFGYEQAVRRVEAHLLDFSGNLYGSELEVEFLDYLREERTFAGAEELRAQIGRDLNRIRQLFSTYQEEEEN